MFPTVENRPGVFHLSALPRSVCLDHLHAHIEIMLPIQGCLVARVEGNLYEVQAGEALLCFPNRLHGYPCNADSDGLMLIFSPALLPDMGIDWETVQPHSPVIRRVSPDAAYARDQLLAVQQSFTADRRLMALLHLLMSGLLDGADLEQVQKPVVGDILYRALEYVSQHYTEKMSLKKAARAAGASEYHLSHLFNARLHMDFRRYVHHLRIDRACRLLAQNSLPVEEVGAACGFASLRSFDRIFKQMQGISPREYRKNHLTGTGRPENTSQ